MAESFAFDVFLWHVKQDDQVARKIANRLRKEGLQVWFEGWRFGSEDDIETAATTALQASRVLLLIVSAATLTAAEWPTLEILTLPFRDSGNPERRLVFLLIDETLVPEVYRAFVAVDWRESKSVVWQDLLRACAKPIRRQPNTQFQNARWQFKPSLSPIRSLALSVDGRTAFSADTSGVISIWNVETGHRLSTYKSYYAGSGPLIVTPKGQWVFEADGEIQTWSSATSSRVHSVPSSGPRVAGLGVDSTGSRFITVFGNGDASTWTTTDFIKLPQIEFPATGRILAALSRNGKWFVSLYGDKLRLLNTQAVTEGKVISVAVSSARSLAVDDEGQTVLIGSSDSLIQIVRTDLGRSVGYLEGHKNEISAIDFLSRTRCAISASYDGSVRVWNVENGNCLIELRGSNDGLLAVAASASGNIIVATSLVGGLFVWHIDLDLTSLQETPNAALRYTNAKVLLVGESGVGKSALAHRLVTESFIPTSSTDGTWATQMRLPHLLEDSTIEREIWLWDFAGQADYRLIHQLFFDETALALLVFNPQHEDPFDALGQWDNDLKRAAKAAISKSVSGGTC